VSSSGGRECKWTRSVVQTHRALTEQVSYICRGVIPVCNMSAVTHGHICTLERMCMCLCLHCQSLVLTAASADEHHRNDRDPDIIRWKPGSRPISRRATRAAFISGEGRTSNKQLTRTTHACTSSCGIWITCSLHAVSRSLRGVQPGRYSEFLLLCHSCGRTTSGLVISLCLCAVSESMDHSHATGSLQLAQEPGSVLHLDLIHQHIIHHPHAVMS
jgi:hypothetical protein